MTKAQSGHCIWITGASSGIGKAVAHAYAAAGHTVAASARSRDALDTLAEEGAHLPGKIMPVPLDVTDKNAAEAAVERIETTIAPIATAILNAGIYLPVDAAAEFDPAPYLRSMDVNYNGTVHCLLPAIRQMLTRQSGHVVIVSSVTGYGGLPTSAAYGPTKAALINLAQSIKFDLDPHGIKTSIVCPGFVDTPATETNAFPMPFLVPTDIAAQRIVDGIAAGKFEITFPRRFTFALKFLNMLPYRLYFPIVRRMTGWS